MNMKASRLGTKFELVKIGILYLTNVQNIHVTLVGIKTSCSIKPALNEIKVSLIEINPQCVLTDGECE
ncbi:hypothetical protein GFL95_19100 [Rhizobium leguminosarum bv. viciae]|jgi:hypothetical protein|uniref:Uncharacterized protein n=1 Tax=Rhizobium leguminosarum TaxID=384 RepID=A0A7M3DRU4_RHILE|nr:hypothetical protein [Rhizobium leguminosarum bv. viciae]TAY51379.1 hypothetical protein ELH90_06540 [Rhizobium leguminosarum]TBZ88017.1 hypothetical protein E0H61_04115 [Rhizobium leguminosarum bv. viciae]